MKNTFKKIGLSTLLAATLLTSVNAGSVGGFGGSLETTQWARFGAETLDRANSYATQLNEYATQMLQYQTQLTEWQRKIDGYQQLIQNIGHLPDQMKDQFLNNLVQLKQAVEFGNAVSYTSASYDQDFKNLFPGFDKYLTDSKNGNLDFQATYKQLNDSTRDTVNGALKSLQIQEQDMKDDETFMSTIRQKMSTAQGEEAVLAVANQLTLHQSEQMKKLQKTIMTQANMTGQYYAMQNEKKAFQEAQAKTKSEGGIAPTLGDEKNTGKW